jgi:hypothetical protein
MTQKTYEWHSACALHRRLRGLVPRSTLLNWIATKKLKTFGRRGTAFAFCPDDLYRIELTETAKRIRLAEQALPPADPGQMTDDQLADSYAAADSERQSLLWLEISKRRERGGQATMRSIQDAMGRRAARLQPLIDVMAGTYWSAERKQTIPVKGKTK